ncbi:hypothetical protein Agub_g914 [Astrephomene gubernaculifera]|uniref:Phosphoglycerate kinase n=1 Tax=Astrephomene gubernaculifera TaxID=47775 RepID=A0AAD3DI23_9CHLO|nr:hypothetical protein Agub_g914 [Astrephomene gubernaculifera]
MGSQFPQLLMVLYVGPCIEPLRPNKELEDMACECPLQDVVETLLQPNLDISSKEFAGKRVLLRVDFNVPIDEATGRVTDASRINAVLPTIKLLLSKNARVILASHFGRPEPKKQTCSDMQALYSLSPVSRWLEQELGTSVFRGLAEDCIGVEAESAVAALQDGQVLLLENTRFHSGDGSNCPAFSASLAALCDVFVNDAFGVVHRDQGSVTVGGRGGWGLVGCGAGSTLPSCPMLLPCVLKPARGTIRCQDTSATRVRLRPPRPPCTFAAIPSLLLQPCYALRPSIGNLLPFSSLSSSLHGARFPTAPPCVGLGGIAGWFAEPSCQSPPLLRCPQGVTRFVPQCYPGPLVRRELSQLADRLYEPERPLGVVLGGAKVADKIGVLAALIEQADVVLVGGRMAFTLLAARGVAVGATQIEENWLEPCRRMMARAAARGTRLLLPSDVLWSASLAGPGPEGGVQQLTPTCCTADSPCIPAGRYGVDIGPDTAAAFREALLGCRTIFWNGPMGKFEVPEFGAGTLAVARAMDEASRRGAITIIGGGDSVAAVTAAGLAGNIKHISTGGGASLELIEGTGMPGLRALVKGPCCQRRSPRATQQQGVDSGCCKGCAGGGCCS